MQYLKWSPDGQHLLYTYYADENDSLRLVDRHGNVQTVSDDIAYIRPGAWSPDGRAIAFFRPTGTFLEDAAGPANIGRELPSRGAEVHEVWTAAVGADGAVGALQLVGHVNIYYGSPYAPQRHIVQVPATGGEPAVVIENAGQPELTLAP